MTAPQQRLCQAPGCGQPISAERLRRHRSVKTCSDDCRDAHRNATTSRDARDERDIEKKAQDLQTHGWQSVSCDYQLQFSCGRPLKDLFDASVPQGHTADAWLREILVTLMYSKGGLGMWALNALVAIGPQEKDERTYTIAHGRQVLCSQIPLSVWRAIRKRAAAEGFDKPASWLRRVVVRAVRGMEHWRPQTPAQQFKLNYVAFCIAGRTDEFFLRVANALMNCRSDEQYHEDKIPRYSRWGVASADALRDHPILHQYNPSSVPKHVLFDELWNDIIRLYNQGLPSENCERRFVEALLDQCDPRVGGTPFGS